MSIIWMCFYDTGITTRLVVGFMIVVSAYLIGTAFFMGHRPERYLSTMRADIATMRRRFLEKVKKVGRKVRTLNSRQRISRKQNRSGYSSRLERQEPTCQYKWWWRRRTSARPGKRDRQEFSQKVKRRSYDRRSATPYSEAFAHV